VVGAWTLPGPSSARRGAFEPEQREMLMTNFLILILFLVVWFLILPRIPGLRRFT